MARTSLKYKSFSSRRKAAASNRLAARAALILGKRVGGGLGAPLATRGFRPYRYGAGNGPELKFVDKTQVDVVLTTTGFVTALNLMATGTDISNRVGRKVMLKSVLLSSNFYNSIAALSAAVQGGMGKVSIVYDSQPNGAAALPAYTDIYVNNTPHAPLNLNNRDRFKVLWTKTWQVAPYTLNAAPAIIAGAPQNAIRKGYKKLNLPVIFGNTGGTIGDIQTGSLLLCVGVDVNNTTSFDYYTRVRYSDA